MEVKRKSDEQAEEKLFVIFFPAALIPISLELPLFLTNFPIAVDILLSYKFPD